MRLYVSVPNYLGLGMAKNHACVTQHIAQALADGLISDYTINYHGEALINRCRNVHADLALLGGWDKLLTIDSDIDFTYEDLCRLLRSPYPIIGGSYPLKCFPITVNFNPLEGRGTELLKSNRGYDYDAFEAFKVKYAMDGIAEVRDLPTGFLLVDRSVLVAIARTAEIYADFHQETGGRSPHFDFYPTRVVDGALLSEDWGFCYLARKAGFPLMFDTNVIVGHIGFHTYRYGQVYGTIDPTSETRDDKT